MYFGFIRCKREILKNYYTFFNLTDIYIFPLCFSGTLIIYLFHSSHNNMEIITKQ